MDEYIVALIAEYALSYAQSGEEGKYWCKQIIGDLADGLRGDYIEIEVIDDGQGL